MIVVHRQSMFWGGAILTMLSSAVWSQPAFIQKVGAVWQLLPGPALRSQWKQQGFSPMVLGDFTAELRKAYPFSARQLPWAVLGDFNGDGKTDLVVDGRSGKSTLRLAFISPNYARQLVEKGEWGQHKRWAYLEHIDPGSQSMPIADQKPIHLTCDGYCEVFPGKAAILYYWKAGKFQEYYLAD